MRLRTVVFFLSCGLAAWAAGQPAAVQYEQLPVDPAYAGETKEAVALRKKSEADARNMLSPFGAKNWDDPNLKRDFANWYTKYVFPEMTQIANLPDLPTKRRNFLDPLHRGPDPARRALVSLTLREMTKIANGNFHPAVRYNAMLIIGELNETEATTQGTVKTTPKPLADALQVMLGVLEDPNQIDAVRVGALLGVLRHVEMSRFKIPDRELPAKDKERVIIVMVRIVEKKDPGAAARTSDGQVWMQRRAVETLATLGIEKYKTFSIVGRIAQFVGDESTPLSLRVEAARALGKFAISDVQTFGLAKSYSDLVLLAGTACRNEEAVLAAIKKEEEAKKQTQPGIAVEVFGTQSHSDPHKLDPIRRRLRQQVAAVQLGLRGPNQEMIRKVGEKPVMPPPAGGIITGNPTDPNQFFKRFDEVLDSILKTVDKNDHTYDTLSLALKGHMTALAGLPRPGAPAASPAAPPKPAPTTVPVATPASQPVNVQP